MARYFKRSYRKRKTGSRSRYFRYRARRYGRYRRNRRYKRRSKVEYKRIEATKETVFGLTYSEHLVLDQQPTPEYAGLYGSYTQALCIGSANPQPYALYIAQGTSNTQRIGNKINPIKLRIFGTLSLINQNLQEVLEQPLSCYLRCVVYQVRNGNSDVFPYVENFSSMNPVFEAGTGTMYSISGQRLFSEYYGRDAYYKTGTTQSITYNPTTVILNAEINKFNTLTRVPYRNGIGGSIKILKEKLYKLNISKNSSFSFRFKTQKPNRMVWPEKAGDPINVQNQTSTTCRNPIYICWWFIPTTPLAYQRFMTDENTSVYPKGSGVVQLSYGLQMYFTDF